MKKFLLHHYWLMAFVLAILPTAMGAQVSYTHDFGSFQPQNVDTVIDGITYRSITVEGLEQTTEPGAPQLPCKILKFSVPYNATDITVSSSCRRSYYTTPQAFSVMPVPHPHDMCDTLPDQLEMDSVIYNSNGYYPVQMAEIVGEGFVTGENHIVTVAVYPMQNNPVTHVTKFNPKVQLSIHYTLDSGQTCNVLVRNDQSLRQQGWDEAKTMVVNASQVESFAANENVAQHQANYAPIVNDSIENAVQMMFLPFDYAIITTASQKSSFKRFAALKRQKGYKVIISDLDYIDNSIVTQSGDWMSKNDGTYSIINDPAGRLRVWLKYLYSRSGTKYVLMGGREVPFRYGYLNSDREYESYNHQQKDNFPTDWYFSDLNTNWNQDDDTFYGENRIFSASQGHFDFNPELYVGRLMSDNAQDIKNYTKKLMTYELNPGHGDDSYLQRALFVDGSDFGKAESVAQAYSDVFTDETVVRVTGNNYPKGSDIIGTINQNHYGLLSLQGHGAPNMVSVNLKESPYHRLVALNNTTPNLANDGLDCLTNVFHPSIYYSWSCEQTPFDYYTEPYNGHTYTGLNMGQSFTLGKDYGGVAFLGYTRYGLVSSYYYENLFALRLADGATRIGEAEALSKTDSRSIFHTLGHNLIGDPELDVWTAQPSRYDNINVTRGDNSITVSGTLSDDAIVAVCDNGYDARRLNAENGSATFTDISPNSTVMVYQHNYLPYIAPLYVQDETINRSQYVIASDAYLGNHVDSNRAAGDVTIPSGVEYEMEFTGKVILSPGFEVKKGGSLSVTVSDY